MRRQRVSEEEREAVIKRRLNVLMTKKANLSGLNMKAKINKSDARLVVVWIELARFAVARRRMQKFEGNGYRSLRTSVDRWQNLCSPCSSGRAARSPNFECLQRESTAQKRTLMITPLTDRVDCRTLGELRFFAREAVDRDHEDAAARRPNCARFLALGRLLKKLSTNKNGVNQYTDLLSDRC